MADFIFMSCNTLSSDLKSLKEVCLNVIAQHFEKFYFAFEKENDSLKWLLTFLKKHYSFEIITKLSDERKLKYEYITMLINEHLKIFHGAWFKNGRNPVFMENFFPFLPNLTTINFDGDCRDEYLKSIVEFCPKIEEFDMSRSFVSDDGIKYLWERKKDGTLPCPNLRIISCEDTSISKEGIKCLIRSLPTLQKIENEKVPLALCSIYEEDMLKHGRVQSCNLLYLNLFQIGFSSHYNDIIKMCLTVCSRLKSIEAEIYEEEQLNLLTIPSLEKVHLYIQQEINVSNFFKIERSNLVSLEMGSCTMSISDLAVCCPKLKELDLFDLTLVDGDRAYSQPFFQNLSSFHFHYAKDDDLTNKAIRLLLSSPKLEIFSISSSDFILFSDAKIDIIKFCDNHIVKELFFGNKIFDVNFIKQILSSCSSLVCVEVNRSCTLSPEWKEIQELVKMLPSKPRLLCS